MLKIKTYRKLFYTVQEGDVFKRFLAFPVCLHCGSEQDKSVQRLFGKPFLEQADVGRQIWIDFKGRMKAD